MAQGWTALVDLAEDLGSVPSIRLAVNNSVVTPVLVESLPSSGQWYCMDVVHRHACRQKSHVHKIKINLKTKQTNKQHAQGYFPSPSPVLRIMTEGGTES